MNKEQFSLFSLIQNSPTSWDVPEWGFPKGRRDYLENDLSCGLREFSEETGFLADQLHIFKHLFPFEEIFMGSNLKSYKHKYFLAFMDNKEEPKTPFQDSEISAIKWLTLEECIQHIRPYNLEKKELIQNIDKILQDNIIIY